MAHVRLIFVTIIFAFATVSHSQLAKWEEIPFSQVKITDKFWAPKVEINRAVSLAHSLEMEERDGVIGNFRLAADRKTEGYQGLVFSDSDLYKVIESCSMSLSSYPDPKLDRQLDEIIDLLARAQMPDGYLNTWFQVKEPGKRLTNLRDCHEIYCAGHLFEAAVAHFQATKKRNLLSIATKYADFLFETFGPGKRMGYCGHPEAELALVKLSRATGNRNYFDLAAHMLRSRGSHLFALEHNIPETQYDGSYFQDDVSIYDHKKIKGHAVRAGYLISAAIDVGTETGDKRMLEMVDRVWKNLTQKNQFVTGGMGSSASNEGFTTDYDLPNLSAYQETCASVAVVMMAHRLALAYGNASQVDAMETALYNGALAGVSRDGKKFFYVNPLESLGNHHRSDWFGCACCPPNITRTLAGLGKYFYAKANDGLAVNLYGSSSVTAGGISLEQSSQYPWNGNVDFSIKRSPSEKWKLHLRIPGWCPGFRILVNGSLISPNIESGYAVINRNWRNGDKVKLWLEMPIQRITSNPNVVDNVNHIALRRGPFIYALEEIDNPFNFQSAYLSDAQVLSAVHEPNLLGGVTVIHGNLQVQSPTRNSSLYNPLSPTKSISFIAIPYFSWDNRKPGAMKVWLPTTLQIPRIRGLEANARVSVSHKTELCAPTAICDGLQPKSSNTHPGALCHFWPRKGTEEWIEYRWKVPQNVSRSQVYWFDDTGHGECRLPNLWSIEYLDNGTWKPVSVPKFPDAALNVWQEVSFTELRTVALRLKLTLQQNWSVGIHEWQVYGE